MSPLPTLYTTAEVAEAFKVTPTAIRRLVDAGKVTPIRLSDSDRSPMRFTDEDVEQLKRALRPAPAATATPRRRRRRAS